MEIAPSVLTQAISNVLKPIVKLLLRNGIACNAACAMLKTIYVQVAEEDFKIPGKKQSISRISTLTGLTRKEVASALNSPDSDLSSMTQEYNRAARVISGWIRDKDFQTKNGQPKDLDPEQGKFSFKELVKRHSGDIPPRAIADELVRVGAIEIAKSGKLRLKTHAYIPEKDVDRKLHILGSDVADLINTISHNIYESSNYTFYQRKVSYNAIPIESMTKIRDQLNKKAQASLESLDKILVKYDSDMNTKITTKGNSRAGVGIYYFEEVNENEPN